MVENYGLCYILDCCPGERHEANVGPGKCHFKVSINKLFEGEIISKKASGYFEDLFWLFLGKLGPILGETSGYFWKTSGYFGENGNGGT